MVEGGAEFNASKMKKGDTIRRKVSTLGGVRG
jgi:hypothetical protein